MQIAVFGLGKMGMQIAKRLHDNGVQVLTWNRSEGPRQEFTKFVSSSKNAAIESKAFSSIDELCGQLTKDRIIWLMLPQGVVDDFLFNKDLLFGHLKATDIVIDGGNSFYKDSIRRATELNKTGVVYFDCGVSGGVWGYSNGFALMVGGPEQYWQTVEPIFKILSSGDNYGLVGPSGAGHFVKMVHNGIEYGMMEAIAEGYGVLEASNFNLDLLQVTKIYQQGSVVRSWLIDLVKDIFEQEDVSATSGIIDATGEGEWTINAGKEFGVDVRVLEDSLAVRKESRDPKNQNKFSNKIVSLMRKKFGGHNVSKK